MIVVAQEDGSGTRVNFSVLGECFVSRLTHLHLETLRSTSEQRQINPQRSHESSGFLAHLCKQQQL